LWLQAVVAAAVAVNLVPDNPIKVFLELLALPRAELAKARAVVTVQVAVVAVVVNWAAPVAHYEMVITAHFLVKTAIA
jgi:hypothetical protein